MRDKLLVASAAAALLAFPAMAQVTGVAAPPAATPSVGATVGATTGAAGQATTATPPVNDPMAMPTDRSTSSSTTATADTGVASNTSATESDLKAGASVRDASGLEIGKISKVTKGKTTADTQVTLSASGKTVSVPASSLSVSGGALVSSQTKDDIWAAK